MVEAGTQHPKMRKTQFLYIECHRGTAPPYKMLPPPQTSQHHTTNEHLSRTQTLHSACSD